MLDRLRLDEKRVDAIAGGIEQVASLPDPVGQDLWQYPPRPSLDDLREQRRRHHQ